MELETHRYQADKKILAMFKRKHPWVFRGALSSAAEVFAPGTLLRVVDGQNNFVTHAVYEPAGAVAMRFLFNTPDPLTPDHFLQRLGRVLDTKRDLIAPHAGYRLLNGEGDFFPALTADVYDGLCVWQPYLTFWDGLLPLFADFIEERLGIKDHLIKLPGRRRHEKAPFMLKGEKPDEPVWFEEDGYRLASFPYTGQKTGFFLDLRPVRRLLPKLCGGADILNAFANNGAFNVIAEKNGASFILSVDEDESCREQARLMAEANGLPFHPERWLNDNVWEYLVAARGEERRYDLVILDPPNMCHSRRALPGAVNGWKKLLENGARLLKEDGRILAVNCSGFMTRKVCEQAFRETNPTFAIKKTGSLPDDHTTYKGFPEGDYLKWWLLTPSGSE